MQSGGEPKAKLGPTDTVFLVMGGMVGSGIFMNPHVVAAHAPSAPAILGAWRVLHRWIALLMVVLVIVHVVHGFLYGALFLGGGVR